ncbi:MAG TPA: ABC transporter ATP-binding protein [Gemmatimonadaceae bacterium]|nr:ABC transporter ATP-binding protein [Gemmatimonadaceae bacterium]
MSSDPSIHVRDLEKSFLIYARPEDRLKQSLFRGRRTYYREFWALRHISLDVERGETVGIIGQNGSGKSTLLQILAGTLRPNQGTVIVRGRVAAILELGAGFNPEFSGRENVMLSAAIVGLTRNEIEDRFADIAAFADIGDFIEQPVKTYSTGMYVRLAFAVATSVGPDVLLIDEALAVGDAAFQARCMRRIIELRERGVSILFVSHDLEAVKRLCDRAYVLRRGEFVTHGAPDAVANWYLGHLASGLIDIDHQAEIPQSAALEPPAPPAGAPPATSDTAFHYFRHGDRRGEIVSVDVLGDDGTRRDAVLLGERCTFRFRLRFHCALPTAVVGFYVRDRLGTDVLGTNTHQERADFPGVSEGTELEVEFSMHLRLRPGFYSLSVGLAYSQFEQRYMDWIDNATVFQVIDSVPGRVVLGLVYPETTTTVRALATLEASSRG